MKKKIVLLVVTLLLSVGLLSGCIEIGYTGGPRVKYKIGLLLEVVESGGLARYTLIFDDDSILLITAKGDKGNFGDYINEIVTVRYFYEDGDKDLIDIKIFDGVEEQTEDVFNQSITGIIDRYEFRIFEGHQYTYPGPQHTGIKTTIDIRPTCYISDEPEPMRNGSDVMVYVIRMSGDYTILEFDGFIQFDYGFPPGGYQINDWGYYEYYPRSMLGTVRFDTINDVNIFKSFEEITKPEGTYWGWNMDGCD